MKRNGESFPSWSGFASHNNEKLSNDSSLPKRERESGYKIELHQTMYVGLVGTKQARSLASSHIHMAITQV